MKKDFGLTKSGKQALLFTIDNGKGLVAQVTNFGGALVSLVVPDKDGNPVDVVLGYDDVSGYENGEASLGGLVGRVANRIGGASFELNGVTYELTMNSQTNCLHGGRDFYVKRIWNVTKESDKEVTFSLMSPDGDQGFPGCLEVSVTYSVTDDMGLQIHYEGVSDQDTLVNMTNHSYFNLAGHNAGSVLDHIVSVNADEFTIANEVSVPTGELVKVAGTPMDFTTPKALKTDIDADYEPVVLGNGYDHNWVIRGEGFRKAADAYCEETGIKMETYTDLPGVQVYTANFLEDKGKGGAMYHGRDAVCFETQYYPDAIHKEHFPGPVLRKGEKYDTTTLYKFV